MVIIIELQQGSIKNFVEEPRPIVANIPENVLSERKFTVANVQIKFDKLHHSDFIDCVAFAEMLFITKVGILRYHSLKNYCCFSFWNKGFLNKS